MRARRETRYGGSANSSVVSPETILARATAKGGQYEAYVAGGLVQFTAAEVGHALTGRLGADGEFRSLPYGAYRLMLVKYANGGETDVRLLIKALADDLGQPKTWSDRCARMMLARAVVDEFVRAQRCPSCEGRGTALDHALLVECTKCDGTGYKARAMAARAAHLELPVRTFSQGPASRMYIDRLRRLAEWEEIGLRRVVGKARAD